MQQGRWALYAKQDYVTPGVPETLAIVDAVCRLKPGARVLEVASGKGEAACELASRHGHTVVGLDVFRPAVQYSLTKARARQLEDRVTFLCADGRSLPLQDGTFDVALCTGGPSIVGIDRCLAEFRRVLRREGWLVVSDWVWEKRPLPSAAVPRSWTSNEFPTLEEYANAVRAADFEVVLAQTLPSQVWEAYFEPMLAVIDAWRKSGDADLVARAERSWANEPKIFYEGLGREYWGYGVFVGRKNRLLDE